MNLVAVEHGTSRVAIKLTYRFASFDNTHAPQTASRGAFAKAKLTAASTTKNKNNTESINDQPAAA
jgi:hypothetical protein